MLRVDADILIFKAGFAAERMRYKLHYTIHGIKDAIVLPSAKAVDAYIVENSLLDYEIEKWRELDKPEQAIWNLRDMINGIRDAVKLPNPMQLLFSGPGNFRYEIFPEYKANRNKSHRPYYESLLKETLVNDYGAEQTIGEEADDQLGIRQYTDWFNGNDDSVLATLDKDLNMIPGLHYNWDKGTMTDVTLKAADRWFYTQLLMGDPTDGVQGIPGMGIKTAEKVLSYSDTPAEMYQMCLDTYADHGIDIETMHKYAKVLWIRRETGKNWEIPA